MKTPVSRRGFLATTAAAFSASGEERIPRPTGKLRMVLDTDTYNEIDDQFAVSYAMLSPEVMSVEALYAAPFLNSRSTSAGDGMEKSYQEIHRVLDRLGKKGAVKVFRGSGRFIKDNGGKAVESPAARDLIKKALASDEMLYVATVGAPTNVASAILMEPRIKERITVVWLGGKPYEFPTAHEFNLQQDPPASQTLYESGIRLMVVPTTNISEMLRTTTWELARFIKGKSKIADYLYEIFVEWTRQHGKPPPYPQSKVIWDISTIAWLVNPKWISSKLVSAPVLTGDLHWGLTQGRHPVRVATHVNRDAVFNDLFARLVKVP